MPSRCIFFTLLGIFIGSPMILAAAPKLVDGKFEMHLRSQTQIESELGDAQGGAFKPEYRTEFWQPAQTAVIVCDMWDSHHCYNAVQRVNDMVGRMNTVLHAARDAGALIIHSPSSCMKPYADHPARKRALAAPRADNVPDKIGEWCHQIPAEEKGKYPLDQSDGGEDDEPEQHQKWADELTAKGLNPRAPWTRQIDAIEIEDIDAISDNGVEVWNLLEERGIQNVILLGVHTNMCVLGRPFGLRQMAQNGKHVVLMRDLTDTMYNPAMWPHVSHHTGTDLIVEHIEKYVCPTVESSDLIDGPPHRFFDDQRPTVAVVVSEFEYESYVTLPAFAHQQLGKDFRVTYALNNNIDNHDLPDVELLRDADVVLMSIWRRALPTEQIEALRAFVDSGKHLVALRTTSHAFSTRNGQADEGRTLWEEFDREVLGGNYAGHHGNDSARGEPPTHVWKLPQAADHPVLAGIPSGEFPVRSWLYKMAPADERATLLLMGRVADRQPHEPVAWTLTTPSGGRLFYTSLGHPDEFAQPEFVRLLTNAVYWAAGKTAPTP